MAWLRIASAAVVFALWRRPWRILSGATASQRWVYLGLGTVLATMNSLFYLAVDRLPLSTVGAVEFLGTVVLAAAGSRTPRNILALLLAVGGVAVLTDVRLSGQAWGFVFAFANCVGFMCYVILGHRIASTPTRPDDEHQPAARNTATDSTATDNTATDNSASDEPAPSPMNGIDQLGLSMLIWTVPALVDTVISCPIRREAQEWVRHAVNLPRSTRLRQ